jgi:transcription-repair coupling factor (superfamily II helicase)
VGFDLYCQLLSEAVEDLKAKTTGEEVTPRPTGAAPSIELPLDAYLPEDYVPDDTLRLGLYQRLAGLKTVEEVEQIGAEIKDRFGAPPRMVSNLLYMLKVKALAAQVGVESVHRQDNQLVVVLGERARVDLSRLEWARREGLRFGPNQMRLDMRRLGRRWAGALTRLLLSLT